MEDDTLEARLSAVERAVTDERSTVQRPDVTDRLDEIESRIRDLEAATQALRGYVGDVKARDDRVERRADAPLTDISQQRPREHGNSVSSRPPTRPERSVSDSENGEPGLVDRMAAWL